MFVPQQGCRQNCHSGVPALSGQFLAPVLTPCEFISGEHISCSELLRNVRKFHSDATGLDPYPTLCQQIRCGNWLGLKPAATPEQEPHLGHT